MKLKKSRKEKKADAPPSPAAIVETEYKRLYFGPEEPTLQLECWEEELSPIQLELFKKADEEHKSIQAKFDSIVKDSGGEVIYSGDQCTGYTLTGNSKGISELTSRNAEILARSRSKSGDVVTTPLPKRRGRGKNTTRDYYEPLPPSPSPPPPPPEPKSKEKKHHRSKKESKEEIKETKEPKASSKKDRQPSPAATPTTRSGRNASKTPIADVQTVSGIRPSEATAIGGLATGGTGGATRPTPVVDLTKEDKNQADSREVSFNKLQGKTFPSLVVVARPYLRTGASGTTTAATSDRAQLDSKVKFVLMHTPTKFTEWLIQQGLVRAEQHCAIHPIQKLKLGMYSDVSKFPYSGGYVWISECCPTRFVSVFSGSLFEGATHPPSVLLKLIYHWACQTNVQNVVQWVKVDNLYVKGLFTWLRAACTAGLHEHLTQLGGGGRKVEVGVISLGTTSHDGSQRQVKVEVLGVLDSEAKLIRLRAVEPLADGERNYKKRFQKILEPLANWVSLDSVILTDLTVDKGTLVGMGFKTVHQVSNTESAKNSNFNIMEYLRRIVPRMFQNTLSLLSRQIIQQFLDELVWREIYGTTAGQAFDNIVTQLAEQTRLDGKDPLAVRLNKISTNPFRSWRYVARSASDKAAAAASAAAAAAVLADTPSVGRRGRKKLASPSPSPPPPPITTSRRSRGERLAERKKNPAPEVETRKETRRKRKINYTEDDDDEEDLIPLQARIKQTKKEKKPKRSLDKEDIPLKYIKKEKDKDMDEPMVDLEGYYFGQVEGTAASDEKIKILVKCPRCSKDFADNVSLLDHLLKHANDDSADTCPYCVTTQSDTDHKTSAHPLSIRASAANYVCLICNANFGAVLELSSHLQRRHAKQELPFVCGVQECLYRSSAQCATIDHFYSAHANTNQLQCPHCLKVVCVYSDDHELRSNVELFLKHLLDHQNLNSVKKCSRCSLKFIHEGTLKEHQIRHHASVLGASPLCSEKHLISKPKNKPTPPVRNALSHSVVESYDNMTLVLPEGMLCRECDSHMDDDKHFVGACRCNRCQYKSGCWRTLLQHSSTCTLESALNPQGDRPRLDSVMYCVCAYSTDNADELLRHLLNCEKQSAYPSQEEAEANKFEDTNIAPSSNQESQLDEFQSSIQNEQMSDYPSTPSISTQLSLDDLAPPSVLSQPDQMEIEQLKNEAYEQPLATPQVVLAPQSPVPEPPTPSTALHSSTLDSYMDSTGEFEPLPAEPPPQPEFEPL